MGADLTTISKESLAILKNKDLIDINQDPESKQAICVHGCSWWETLTSDPTIYATKSKGDIIALVYNWRPYTHYDNSFSLKDLGVTLKDGEKATVINLWDKTESIPEVTRQT